MTTATEDKLLEKAAEAVAVLSGQDVYFQEAGAKFLVRELCWLLVDGEGEMISPQDLADHLDTMADLLRNHGREKHA